MPSEARKAFEANTQDIERLLELHKQQGGDEPGRRFGLEVLNKSAIVLITSFWEAYCEDVAAQGLRHIIDHASPSTLPTELKKLVAKELKGDSHELKVWELAGDGWRDVLRARLTSLQEARNRKLNTPKTQNIDELFLSALGLENVSKSWKWPKKMTVERARKKLDRFVTLRGEIAHRGTASKSVKKAQVVDYYEFVRQIGLCTDSTVDSHVKGITGKSLD